MSHFIPVTDPVLARRAKCRGNHLVHARFKGEFRSTFVNIKRALGETSGFSVIESLEQDQRHLLQLCDQT
ncbi:MAG: hypothetical protein OXI44_03765 [Bacteroidota bacterium]|nr:hypothetical protein [Bacteroidota bacterium]